jgi:hypothetical protein
VYLKSGSLAESFLLLCLSSDEQPPRVLLYV